MSSTLPTTRCVASTVRSATSVRIWSIARDVSAYAGSIVLGMLLGFVPAIGAFTGLPLDVRHVTLSTGQVVLAAASVGGWAENRIVWPLGGVALMFFLNLGVSFSLALWVASRARGVGLAMLAAAASALRATRTAPSTLRKLRKSRSARSSR